MRFGKSHATDIAPPAPEPAAKTEQAQAGTTHLKADVTTVAQSAIF
jgi:hypothetical protein